MPSQINLNTTKPKNTQRKQKKKDPTSSWSERILNLCIGVSIVILVMLIASLVFNILDDNRNYFTADRMLYYVEDGNYARVVGEYYEDGGEQLELTDNSDIALKNLAVYTDAAFMERAFTEAGLSEKAAAQGNRKDAVAGNLGIFSGEQSKIDALYSSYASPEEDR